MAVTRVQDGILFVCDQVCRLLLRVLAKLLAVCCDCFFSLSVVRSHILLIRRELLVHALIGLSHNLSKTFVLGAPVVKLMIDSLDAVWRTDGRSGDMVALAGQRCHIGWHPWILAAETEHPLTHSQVTNSLR